MTKEELLKLAPLQSTGEGYILIGKDTYELSGPGGMADDQVVADELVRRFNNYGALVEALKTAYPMLKDAAEPSPTYGFFHGGDPREFTPDQENSPEELEAHRLACEAWERDERPEVPTSSVSQGLCVDVSPFGLGTFVFRFVEEEETFALAKNALSKAGEL